MKNFKALLLLTFLSVPFLGFSQTVLTSETYPIFPECQNTTSNASKTCFNEALFAAIKTSFRLPEDVIKDKYTGEVGVLFEVNENGAFKVIHSATAYKSLKEEIDRVFTALDTITPPKYRGNPTFMQFSVVLPIPLQGGFGSSNTEDDKEDFTQVAAELEYEKMKQHEYDHDEFSSQLNIPFQHQNYAVFDAALNAVGTNAHTGSKPLLYNTVHKYYDIKAENESLSKHKTSWFGRKFWDEHMVTIKGDDYWITGDVVADLRLGRDFSNEINTYNNTRAVQIQGGLGKKFNFYTSVYESQGRFANYVDVYARSLAPDGGNPGIIPGRGIAKEFGESGFDYPVAEGYLSYSPDEHFNFQLGTGKNFIGDGYRSLILSDVASPHTYFKMTTNFWKIQYTNIWMALKDVRPEVTEDGSFMTKYMALHYLSWNVTKKLNLGFFESVIWKNDNNRGFDVSYLNPVIFYRAIEFSTGSRAGNAALGASFKYKWNNSLNFYGQLMIDEFSVSNVFASNKSWKNKFGYQLGAKYYDAFGVKNLMLQGEWNKARPYTYSHDGDSSLNYGHNNQSMAHLWGGNFTELIGIARYRYDRWFANAKMIVGKKGFDFNTADDSFSYGGDIYRNYDDRNADFGIAQAQGNTANIFIADLQAGYLVNPATNLRFYGNVTYRDFSPLAPVSGMASGNTVWFQLGFRTDLFNWYNDY